MKNYCYCVDCKRIFITGDKCSYCSGEDVKDLVVKAPVNVLGSKLKGKVIGMKGDTIKVLIRDENNAKFTREYTADQLKKVL